MKNILSRNRCLSLMLMLPLSFPLQARPVEEFVNAQLQRYPALRLLDLYKSCFQDYMGAEHLVTDSEAAARYLNEELQTATDYPSWYSEPCGIEGRYVRVSLVAVKNGKLTSQQLLDAFLQSANRERPSVKKWKRRWHNIFRTIDKMHLNLPHYDEDRNYIDSILSRGEYAISHSPEYRSAYHPHYRIVERHIYDQEIKPFLTFSDEPRL